MDDQPGKHTSLLFVQPTMLKMVMGAAALWGFGVPIVLAIKTGELALLLLAPLGLVLVPAAVVFAMFGRLMIWIQLVLFWYIRGIVAALAMLGFGLFAVVVLFTPATWVDEAARPALALLPHNALAIGTAVGVLSLMAVGAYMVVRRRAPRRGMNSAHGGSLSSPTSISPGVPAGGTPLVPPKPLTYLQHRRGKSP